MKNLIIGLAGSLRSKLDPVKTEKMIWEIENREMLNYIIEKLSRDQAFSNTDLCLISSMYGVKEYGVKERKIQFKILNLRQLVSNTGRIRQQKCLKNLLKTAKGIVIASPVYFGDRSSLVDEFINFMIREKILQGKVIGSISVGAKRNGGQETTNIYILKEVNDHGAFVVGNGPPVSQYGGTAWAGNIGALRDDEFGIMTSLGTGKKVAEMTCLLEPVRKDNLLQSGDTIKICLWIMEDYKRTLINEMKGVISSLQKKEPKLKWEVIDFTKLKIKRCKACDICPWYKDNKESLYKCRIKKDAFAIIYEKLINTDGIIICAYHNTKSKSVYQKVLERTRQIRRDNFLLTNVPVTSFTVEENNQQIFLGSCNLFSLKVMTSFLRHNTVIFPPIFSRHNDKSDWEKKLLEFGNLCKTVSYNKKRIPSESTQYIPIGY